MATVKCKVCLKEFYAKPSHLKLGYGKFCSAKCRIKASRKGKYVRCEICDKKTWKLPRDIKRSKSGKFFCGKSCQTKWRNKHYSGTNHYLWKGGEYIYRKKMLATEIKPICKNCKINDLRILIVHHKDHNRKNNKKENLVWLCRNCHYLIHNY